MQTEQFELHARVEETHWWFTARRKIVCSLVRALVPPGAGGMVIDVGCGTGANIAALAADYQTVGIDTEAQAVRSACDRFPGVRFLHGYAPEDLGDEMKRADCVLLNDVLEHVPDDFLMLSRLLAPMRPGAFLLLTVPAMPVLWSPHDVAFGHYRRYERARLEQVWEGLPVTPILVSYFNARLYPLARAARAVSARRGRAVGAASTDVGSLPGPINRTLRSAFASEAGPLRSALERGLAGAPVSAPVFGAGVSLVAVLRREEGDLTPRPRPTHVAPDRHDPRLSAKAVEVGVV